MELKCPSCLSAALNATGESIPRTCPSCGAAIEVLEHGERLTLLGAKRQEDNASEHPALAACEKWRVRAVFIALLGFSFFFFTFLDLKNSYVTYGYFFWKNPQNLIFPLIAGVLAAFFMLAGCWLFRYVGRQKKKYETELLNKKEE